MNTEQKLVRDRRRERLITGVPVLCQRPERTEKAQLKASVKERLEAQNSKIGRV